MKSLSPLAKSGSSPAIARAFVGVLGCLWLCGVPACLPSGSPKRGADAGARDTADAGGASAEVAQPGDGTPGADAAEASVPDLAPAADIEGPVDAMGASDSNPDGIPDAPEPEDVPVPSIEAHAPEDLVPIDAVDAAAADVVSPTLDGKVGGDVGRDGDDAGIGDPDANRDALADGRAEVADGDGGRDARDTGSDGASDDGIDGGQSCCGCLCRDPAWSCSRDTCLDPAGHAIGLGAEAGFFELSGGDYVAEGVKRQSPIHRIWYSFHPAASAPESKPLAVLFNGGPGSATSVYLFCFNTAPYTLDPAFAGTAQIVSNASSWTQFANLLYIDSPGTGFSYPLPLADGTQPSVGTDVDRDAASFVRAVVRFLDRHPALQRNRVVLVGESYGGTRATLMLGHLFGYATLTATGATYQDQALYDELVQHFTAIFPGSDATHIPADKIATQFGHQVLIQPVVAGDAQWQLRQVDTSVCVADYDVYQCNEADGWSDEVTAKAATNLAKLANLRQALGVEPTTIEWLYASARSKAYSRRSSYAVDAPELTAAFGRLGSEDNYLLTLSESALGTYPGARTWHDPNIGTTFLADVAYANTLITNAKFDTVVPTSTVATAFASYTAVVTGATVDTTPRAGVVRPGWIEVDYVPGVFPGVTRREIRFPSYASAGHTVTIRDSANLLADVTQWYAGSLAAPHVTVHATPAPPAAARRVSQPGPAPAWSERDLYLGP